LCASAAGNACTGDNYANLSRGSNQATSRVWSVQPNVSLIKGTHNIRAGFDIRYTTVERRNLDLGAMQIVFDRTFTQRDFATPEVTSGSQVASLLLGAPIRGVIDNNVQPDFNWPFFAPWVQDDWKVTPRLTVNLGFRWDFSGPFGEADNQLNYGFDPTVVVPVAARDGRQVTGGLTFVGVDGNPDRPWNYDKNNVQFRGGFAYQVAEHTVVRGGYGRYFLNPAREPYPTGDGANTVQGFSIQTPLVGSNDGNRTPTYNLSNPFPLGVQQPPGGSLGPATFLGRDIQFPNNDFVIPYVDQFSVGIQHELPWGVVAEVSYAGSRSRDQETEFRGFNEPPRSLQDRCDVTLGGNPAFCNDQLSNPFFGVAGFEGTARFTSPTLSRFELSRPYPQFGEIRETFRNDGKIDYDSLQFVGNKRWSKGLTLNATYTWVPRYEQVGSASGFFQGSREQGAYNAFIDNATRELYVGPYFSHRDHRLTASGVWEFPFGQDSTGVKGVLLKGWSVAPMFVYQSGQPWRIPPNVEIVGDPSLPVEKTGQFIYGVQPCVAQRNATTGTYQLLPVAVAYGCTEPNFLIRAPFQARDAQFMDDRLRRPSFWQLDLNFAKTTQITDRVRFQIRFEAFNVFNSPMYDERDYERNTGSADFGRINRNVTGQSNFQRFVQLGFRVVF
jgi:hypothetical protein